MLERLISAEEINKKPWKIFLLGIIYASFSIIIAYIVFPSAPDISLIFLATILCTPLLHKFVSLEQDSAIKEIYTKRYKVVKSFFQNDVYRKTARERRSPLPRLQASVFCSWPKPEARRGVT